MYNLFMTLLSSDTYILYKNYMRYSPQLTIFCNLKRTVFKIEKRFLKAFTKKIKYLKFLINWNYIF